MNNTIKTYSILTWCLAVGKDFADAELEKLHGEGNFQDVKKAGELIHKNALTAIRAMPMINMGKKAQQKISKNILFFDSIGYVKSGVKRTEVMVALMLVAVEDIMQHISNPKRLLPITKLHNAILELSTIIDPEADQTAHYIRGDYAYQRWLGK